MKKAPTTLLAAVIILTTIFVPGQMIRSHFISGPATPSDNSGKKTVQNTTAPVVTPAVVGNADLGLEGTTDNIAVSAETAPPTPKMG